MAQTVDSDNVRFSEGDEKTSGLCPNKDVNSDLSKELEIGVKQVHIPVELAPRSS